MVTVYSIRDLQHTMQGAASMTTAVRGGRTTFACYGICAGAENGSSQIVPRRSVTKTLHVDKVTQVKN